MELEKLINIKSFDTTQNTDIIEYLISKFQDSSMEILKIKNPDCEDKYNLLIGINCGLKNIQNAIILSGHIDTVTANEKAWSTNPYKATIVDNRIYGLGSVDMKCFFSSIIENIKKISSLSAPIIVAITCDEETNLYGADEITKTLGERNITPVFTLVGEPTSMRIATTSKSCFEWQIDVSGKSCHSSNPKNGINAVYIISKIANFIEKLGKKYKNTTLSVGKINGGEKINIVPASCSVCFDLRSKTTNEQNKCISLLNKKLEKLKKQYNGCDIVLKKLLEIPPLDNKNTNIIKDIIKFSKLEESEFLAGSEAGYFQALGGEAILFGVGDLSLAHKANEFLDLDDYKKYNKYLLDILKFISDKI